MIRAFIRFSDAAALAGALLAAIFLALICLLLFAEIGTRVLTGGTLGESWEFASYFMSLSFLLGAAYTLRTGGHVRVGVLRFADERRDRVVEFIASTAGLVLAVFLALALNDLAYQSFARDVVSATPARTPLFLPRAGLALGAWLLALQLLARIAVVISGEDVNRSPPDADSAS